MKIYISADIEGITGVTHWDETELHKEDSKVFREQMTAEVVAACEGALQAGADEIWIKDAHDTGRNLIASKLPRDARLIRGWTGHPLMMVQELDTSFAAVLMIGYHSRAGAGSSPLAHTMSGKLAHVSVNGRDASEFLIHAYAAASLQIPVVLVSGDRGLCDDVVQLNPHIATVAVKDGIGEATVNIHPDLAIARIRDAAARALGGPLAQCQIPLPSRFVVQVSYRDHYLAHVYGFYPGATQTDAATVQFESDSYFEVMRFLMFAP